MSCKNLYSVKSYDETNMKVFALSLWEKVSWGLTDFDEFSNTGVYRGIHYLLIFALKHILWVLVRTASLRRFLLRRFYRVPSICFEQKNEKYHIFLSETNQFYIREILQYIAWACFRNGSNNNYVGVTQKSGASNLFFQW